MFKIKTIWQKFKKRIIIAIFGSVALASGLGAIPKDTDIVIADKISNIQNLQETNKQANGKYKYRPKEIVQPLFSDKTSYEVHEYEAPGFQLGYIIYIEKTQGDITYQKAIATGVSAKEFGFDWKIIENKTASTTK